MKKHNNILERIAYAADLGTEPLPKLPLIELAGENRVLVENHKGVIQYGDHEICLKVSYGYISICGNRLELARMTKEQLIITGYIESVRLCRGRK
jgi:sporulation protein YqfC